MVSNTVGDRDIIPLYVFGLDMYSVGVFCSWFEADKTLSVHVQLCFLILFGCCVTLQICIFLRIYKRTNLSRWLTFKSFRHAVKFVKIKKKLIQKSLSFHLVFVNNDIIMTYNNGSPIKGIIKTNLQWGLLIRNCNIILTIKEITMKYRIFT